MDINYVFIDTGKRGVYVSILAIKIIRDLLAEKDKYNPGNPTATEAWLRKFINEWVGVIICENCGQYLTALHEREEGKS